MQAISVELLLAENDFMSDVLETQRERERERERGRGAGLYHCVHGDVIALKLLITAAVVVVVSLMLLHHLSSFPFLKIPNGSERPRSTNPSGFTSLAFLLKSVTSPLGFPSTSCSFHIRPPSFLLRSRMGALEPGRSADMSNVAETDSYAKTSAVSVEPAMTQAQEQTHTHTH